MLDQERFTEASPVRRDVAAQEIVAMPREEAAHPHEFRSKRLAVAHVGAPLGAGDREFENFRQQIGVAADLLLEGDVHGRVPQEIVADDDRTARRSITRAGRDVTRLREGKTEVVDEKPKVLFDHWKNVGGHHTGIHIQFRVRAVQRRGLWEARRL